MILWIVLTLMVAVAVSGLTFALARRRDAGQARATATSILAAQLADVELQIAAGQLLTEFFCLLFQVLRANVKNVGL